jgi:predicted lipoprotein with Yx(FWY)xxD motif
MSGSRTRRARVRHLGRARYVAVACGAALLLSAYGMGTTAAVAKSTKPTVAVAKVAPLGAVLVDSKGRTLYTFTDNGQAVACSGECAVIWPPLAVKSGAKAKSGHGVTGIATMAGTRQVTEHGLPLYLFSGDTKAGQANGEGINSFGGIWHAAKASSSAGSTTPTMAPRSSSSSGSGY